MKIGTTQDAPLRRRIPLALLDRMESSRSLDEANIAKLQESIATWGVMQPPVAILRDGRYLLCIGNHRCEALARNGELEVECLVLPEGTSPEEALIRSLHENHVRADESIADTLNRVNALMQYHGCKTFAEGAALAGLSSSKVSRIRFAMERLSPEALALVREHKIGWSVAYEVARRATNLAEQKDWLCEHVRGSMNRESIAAEPNRKARAARTAREIPKADSPKPTRLTVKENGIVVKLTIPADLGCENVCSSLRVIVTQFEQHLKDGGVLSSFSSS